jgi:hypothetical protein
VGSLIWWSRIYMETKTTPWPESAS